MKKVGFLTLGAVLALPPAAHGKVPLPNGAFGKIEANLDVRSCQELRCGAGSVEIDRQSPANGLRLYFAWPGLSCPVRLNLLPLLPDDRVPFTFVGSANRCEEGQE